METSSFFAGISQQDVRLRNTVIKAPLFYKNLSFFSGVFLADLDAARALVPTSLHFPLAPVPGRALVAVHCFEYVDCDIGPYNEVSLSIAISHGSRPWLGLGQLLQAVVTRTFHGFVVDLPVTTEPALWGGIDFFNFPKYLADISFEENNRSRTCTIRDVTSGAPILSARLTKPVTRVPGQRLLAGKTLKFLSYPNKNGTTLRAEMRVHLLDCAIALGGRQRLSLELGSHPRADVFRRLRLSAPLQIIWAPRCQAILSLPLPAGEGT